MSNTTDPVFLAVAGIFKNEAPYILEWIAHHRVIGIRHFFIADNDSTDASSELFEVLARLGHIELIRHSTEPGTKPQIPAYNKLIEMARDKVRWMAFIDSDEFIWPTCSGASLEDFLKSLDARMNVGALTLNWSTYGSSRNYFFQDAPVMQRFSYRAQKNHALNQHIKSIIKLEAFDRFESVHGANLKSPYRNVMSDGLDLVEPLEYAIIENGKMSHSDRVCWDGFRINHYVIKSWAEFTRLKVPRGRAFTSNDALTRCFFLGHDNNDCLDPVPTAHLQALAREMQVLRDELRSAGFDPDRLDRYSACAGPKAGWQSAPIEGCIDAITRDENGLTISGWALVWRDSALRELVLEINGRELPLSHFEVVPRPDVQTIIAKAPLHSGFRAVCTGELLPVNIDAIEVKGIAEEGFSEYIAFGQFVSIDAMKSAT